MTMIDSRLHPLRKLILLGGIAAALVGLQPWLWKYVKTSAESLQMKRLEEKHFSSLGDDLLKITATLDQQELALSELDVVFPTQESTSQVVERLERLADEEGISFEIQSITERETNAAGKKLAGLAVLNITVEAFGSPAELLRYIERVEHTPELATVDSWVIRSIAGREAGQVPLQHNLVAEISFYFMES